MENQKFCFTMEDIKDCYSSETFYKAIGMEEMFKEHKITDVKQMKIRESTFDIVLQVLKNNWKKCEKVNFYTEDWAKQVISFDWHNFAPYNCDEVDEWCVVFDENVEVE